MSEPKNQHYLPQFYLSGFTSPVAQGQLHVFRNGHEYWTRCGTKNVASKEFLHSFRDAEGNFNHSLETMFSELESHFSPVLKKVLEKQPLTMDERMMFSVFVLVMQMRVPAQVEHWNKQFSKISQMILHVIHAGLVRYPEAFDELKRQMHETGATNFGKIRPEDWDPSRVQVTANPHATMMALMQGAVEIAEELFRMGWVFLVSEAPDYFITSDNPVCMHDPTNTSRFYGTGFRHENVEITMPLSRAVALVVGWKNIGWRYQSASREFVEQINMRTGLFAERELIAPQKFFPGSRRSLAHFYPGTSQKMGVQSAK